MREVLHGFDSLGRSHDAAVVCFEGCNPRYDVVLAARPVLTRVACEIDFFEVGQFAEASDTFFKILSVNEVDSEVKLLEAFAAFDVLDFGDVVERNVEVLKFFELVEVLQSLDDVILQVQNFKVAAEHIEVLDFHDFLLVKRNLGKRLSTSSSEVSMHSLCSARFLSSSSVMRDILI